MLHTIFINFKIKQTRLFITTVFLLTVGFTSCSDFIEIDVSGNEVSPEVIFSTRATVNTAFVSIYTSMREDELISGKSAGIGNSLGLYTDELVDSDSSREIFFNNALLASTQGVSRYWSSTYNLIFQANRIIEGVENSNTLSTEDKNIFRGQALFLRAFLNSYLVELFGDIPIAITTDSNINTRAERAPVAEVYEQIIKDLTEAKALLDPFEALPVNEERIFPDKFVVDALLARVYLYRKNWAMAEAHATTVIDYIAWEPDLTMVFNHEFTVETYASRIWAFKTDVLNNVNTNQGALFFVDENDNLDFHNTITNRDGTTNLIDAFEPGDKRKIEWLGAFEIKFGTIVLDVIYFPAKYKESEPGTDNTTEYPLVFRLAEQYLIRAEARAALGDIAGAQEDLNMIRTRAGLPNTTANTTATLLDAVIQERRVELFTEYGHRFFDLKRTGRINTAMQTAAKPGWDPTDVLLPIPERELEINPNLLPQNPGY